MSAFFIVLMQVETGFSIIPCLYGFNVANYGISCNCKYWLFKRYRECYSALRRIISTLYLYADRDCRNSSITVYSPKASASQSSRATGYTPTVYAVYVICDSKRHKARKCYRKRYIPMIITPYDYRDTLFITLC